MDSKFGINGEWCPFTSRNLWQRLCRTWNNPPPPLQKFQLFIILFSTIYRDNTTQNLSCKDLSIQMNQSHTMASIQPTIVAAQPYCCHGPLEPIYTHRKDSWHVVREWFQGVKGFDPITITRADNIQSILSSASPVMKVTTYLSLGNSDPTSAAIRLYAKYQDQDGVLSDVRMDIPFPQFDALFRNGEYTMIWFQCHEHKNMIFKCERWKR